MRLTGKTAIITGGGRGIGRAICLRLSQEGAAIVVAECDQPEAKQVAAEIEKAGGSAIAVTTDIRRVADVRRMVEETLKQLGRIDILVNNAGVATFCPFLEVSEELWETTLNTNLKGMFFCAQAVAPIMIEQGWGRIINLASTASEVGIEGLAHYCASKGGVRLLTRAMALELGPRNITVNAVAPGTTETRLNTHLLADPAFRKKQLADIPLRRVGETTDIAGAVAFLASSDANYITGEILYVDGGYVVR